MSSHQEKKPFDFSKDYFPNEKEASNIDHENSLNYGETFQSSKKTMETQNALLEQVLDSLKTSTMEIKNALCDQTIQPSTKHPMVTAFEGYLTTSDEMYYEQLKNNCGSLSEEIVNDNDISLSDDKSIDLDDDKRSNPSLPGPIQTDNYNNNIKDKSNFCFGVGLRKPIPSFSNLGFRYNEPIYPVPNMHPSFSKYTSILVNQQHPYQQYQNHQDALYQQSQHQHQLVNSFEFPKAQQPMLTSYSNNENIFNTNFSPNQTNSQLFIVPTHNQLLNGEEDARMGVPRKNFFTHTNFPLSAANLDKTSLAKTGNHDEEIKDNNDDDRSEAKMDSTKNIKKSKEKKKKKKKQQRTKSYTTEENMNKTPNNLISSINTLLESKNISSLYYGPANDVKIEKKKIQNPKLDILDVSLFQDSDSDSKIQIGWKSLKKIWKTTNYLKDWSAFLMDEKKGALSWINEEKNHASNKHQKAQRAVLDYLSHVIKQIENNDPKKIRISMKFDKDGYLNKKSVENKGFGKWNYEKWLKMD